MMMAYVTAQVLAPNSDAKEVVADGYPHYTYHVNFENPVGDCSATVSPGARSSNPFASVDQSAIGSVVMHDYSADVSFRDNGLNVATDFEIIVVC